MLEAKCVCVFFFLLNICIYTRVCRAALRGARRALSVFGEQTRRPASGGSPF